jgi:hypothetical protein
MRWYNSNSKDRIKIRFPTTGVQGELLGDSCALSIEGIRYGEFWVPIESSEDGSKRYFRQVVTLMHDVLYCSIEEIMDTELRIQVENTTDIIFGIKQ